MRFLNLNKKIYLPAILLVLLFNLFATQPVFAQAGLEKSANAAGLYEYTPKDTDINTVAGNVIGAALSLVGVIFFILVVYGGILWMTARGNQEQVTKGRNTIIAASIGLVVLLASYAITNFVLESLQGAGAAPGGEQQTQQTEGGS